MNMTTYQDSTSDSSSARQGSPGSLEHDIRKMSAEPGSGVRMCHEQRRTAVYLSDDGEYIVEHEPNGTIRRIPLDAVHGSSS